MHPIPVECTGTVILLCAICFVIPLLVSLFIAIRYSQSPEQIIKESVSQMRQALKARAFDMLNSKDETDRQAGRFFQQCLEDKFNQS